MAIAPLQIPTYQQPADLDFSPLAKLPQLWRQAQQESARREVYGALGQGAGNLREASMRLAQAGDLQGALTLANIDRLHATQALKDFDLARRQGHSGAHPDSRMARPPQGNVAGASRVNPVLPMTIPGQLRAWGVEPPRF